MKMPQTDMDSVFILSFEGDHVLAHGCCNHVHFGMKHLQFAILKRCTHDYTKRKKKKVTPKPTCVPRLCLGKNVILVVAPTDVDLIQSRSKSSQHVVVCIKQHGVELNTISLIRN